MNYSFDSNSVKIKGRFFVETFTFLLVDSFSSLKFELGNSTILLTCDFGGGMILWVFDFSGVGSDLQISKSFVRALNSEPIPISKHASISKIHKSLTLNSEETIYPGNPRCIHTTIPLSMTNFIQEIG
ncbi:hypothetical protein RCL_jg21979.t1 [Rhizophagus clarus]|uniref:Uncharacterized protein n=1 Tax=Rhizophagus clarus TaxID=94130 RepID=A0A8H3R3T9_9GLOM|nr:hypothetical protein RCL_jg21979.t1 [Rhizophagus clarus]